MPEDLIAEALGVNPNMDTTPSVPASEDAADDEKNVRANLYDLIETARTAVDGLAHIAASSQDHESYSALASLLRTAGGLNKTLLDVGSSYAYRTTKVPKVTNNTLVLTTTELQKLLESKKD